MAKILVIVESPGKIKKIQAYLGSNYIVMASVGHIMDLPKKKLGIDIKNNFTPTYEILDDKHQIVKSLQAQAKKSKEILIATDKDREGEMIGENIAQALKLKDPKRIVFDSITKTDLLKAIQNPRKIDIHMVNAQKGRRILDRLVGYLLSPILWKHIQKGLSAGRVQSVVVRLIVEQENKINTFFSNEIDNLYKFEGYFNEKNQKSFKSDLYDLKKINKNNQYTGTRTIFNTQTESRQFIKICQNSTFEIANIFDKVSIRNSPAPFTTSTLQQEASRKLGLTIKQTMTCAQNLYNAGFITYMRTDATNLSQDAQKAIKEYIVKTFGENYYKESINKQKTKNIQEAHEACRPSKIDVTYVEPHDKISNNEVRLYDLIWKRTIASQMEPAQYTTTNIQISISKTKNYYFTTMIENISFEGYLKIYKISNQDEDEDEDEDKDRDKNKNIKIPPKNTILEVERIFGKNEYKKPPSRFNEASLVDKLDPRNLNIGRPSTYATIISTIQNRNYVKIDNIEGVTKKIINLEWKTGTKINEISDTVILGEEKNKLIPTTLGTIVNDFLVSNFPEILDYQFTSLMENKLDDVADNKIDWTKVVQIFYDVFEKQLTKVKNEPILKDKLTRELGKIKDKLVIATMAKFGPVIKLDDGKKGIYAPIKPPLTLETITLDDAKKLLEYPKNIGKIDKNDVLLKKGKFGFYVTIGKTKLSVEKEDISIDEIKELLKDKQKKNLLEFEDKEKTYTILEGQYGKYIKIQNKKDQKKKNNVKLPEEYKLESLTLEIILDIIDKHFKKPKKKFFKKTK